MPPAVDLNAIFSAIRDLSVPGALLYLIIRSILDHRKSLDTVNEKLTDSEVDDRRRAAELDAEEAKAKVEERKRQDELAVQYMGIISRQADKLDKLADAVNVVSEERREEAKVQAETLRYRESQSAQDRLEREKDARDHREQIKEQISVVSELTLGLKSGFEGVTQSVTAVHQAGAEVITRKIDAMGEQFSQKIKPVDEQLAAQTQALSDLQKSMEALRLTIEDKMATVPDQFQEMVATFNEVKASLSTTLEGMVAANEEMKAVHLEIKAITVRLDAIAPKPPDEADPPETKEVDT